MAKVPERSVIVIDPGHGGTGTSSEGKSTAIGAQTDDGVLERDITVNIAERISAHLQPLTVVLTRTALQNPPLNRRIARCNEMMASVFVSIHVNENGTTARGTEFWVHTNATDRSRRLAQDIHRELVGANLADRGVFEGDLAVLYPQQFGTTTAACLIEVDYLTNPEAKRLLTDPGYLDRIGGVIAQGITAYVNAHAGTDQATGYGISSALLEKASRRNFSPGSGYPLTSDRDDGDDVEIDERENDDCGENNDTGSAYTGYGYAEYGPDLHGVAEEYGYGTGENSINRVYLWAANYLLNPRSGTQAMERIRDINPTDIVVVVNDHMGRRRFNPFHLMQSRDRIIEVCGQLRNAGIRPHLMSFLVAREDWMHQAAAQLPQLCRDARVETLMFDTEEPWRLFRIDHQALVDSAFVPAFVNNKPCPLGITDIVFHSPSIRPLIPHMDYCVPQGYSLHKVYPQGHAQAGRLNPVYNPGRTQQLAHDRWKGYHKPLIMGLAAFRQEGAGGYHTTEAMQRAIDATRGLNDPSVTGVAYWSLRHITGNPRGAVYQFVRNLCVQVRE